MRAIVGIFMIIGGCTCELPIDEKDLQATIQTQLQPMLCTIQTQLQNALQFPIQELCNLHDDDCDGRTDEELDNIPCSNACGTGTKECIQGAFTPCSAPQPKTEICNNHDDDCDGSSDEELTALDETCDGGIRRCRSGIWQCEELLQLLACTPHAVVPIVNTSALAQKTAWNYTLHPSSFTEHTVRVVTVAYTTSTHLVNIANYSVDDEALLGTVVEESIPWQATGLIIDSASSAQRTLITASVTKSNTPVRLRWYLIENDILTQKGSVTENDSQPRAIIAAMALGGGNSLLLGTLERTAGGVYGLGMTSIPPKEEMSRLLGAFLELPHYDMHLYHDIPYAVWQLPKKEVVVASLFEGQSHAHNYFVEEGAVGEECVFGEGSTPTVGLLRAEAGTKKLYVLKLDDDASLTAPHTVVTLSSDRSTVAFTLFGKNIALTSGVATDAYEYGFLSVHAHNLVWEYPLGLQHRPGSRAVSVTHEMVGMTIHALADDEGSIRMHTVFCQ